MIKYLKHLPKLILSFGKHNNVSVHALSPDSKESWTMQNPIPGWCTKNPNYQLCHHSE